MLGGGLAVLLAVVVLTGVADLVISRGQAQLAADAAALAAMGGSGAYDPVTAEHDAARLARANRAQLLACCGSDPSRREVTVVVTPVTGLVAAVVPRVRARAAAALVASAEVEAPRAGAPPAAGARLWPITAPVTSGFGMRTHPLTGASRLHTGVDLGAPAGTAIHAAAAGVVVVAGPLGGYGNAVDIAHDGGVTTRYGHQSRVLVRPGQQVVAGQVIGLVGATGAATGPHLHFEVRTSGGAIDPLSWLPPRA